MGAAPSGVNPTGGPSLARNGATTGGTAFTVRWRDEIRIAPEITTGMTEAEAARVSVADQPMMVYVYENETGEEAYAVEKDATFFSDKVAVGARFFKALRIDAESAANDGVLKDYARKAPCLVFVRPNFEVAKVVRAKFSTSKVFSAMCTTLRKDYENCAQTVLKKQKDLAKDRVEISKDRVELMQLGEKIDEERSDSRRATLVRKRDALQEQVDEAEAKIDDAEAKLYELVPKSS